MTAGQAATPGGGRIGTPQIGCTITKPSSRSKFPSRRKISPEARTPTPGRGIRVNLARGAARAQDETYCRSQPVVILKGFLQGDVNPRQLTGAAAHRFLDRGRRCDGSVELLKSGQERKTRAFPNGVPFDP